MRPEQEIQRKRKTPRATFRKLHAATRGGVKKRRQRAATTAVPEDLSEVPGVGISRALVVILLLHVAAIAGIWLHNKWSEDNILEAQAPLVKTDKAPTAVSGLERYTVDRGDNYAIIARNYGVDESELRRVNDNKNLQSGWIINIPKKRAGVTAQGQVAAAQVANPPQISPVSRPAYQPQPPASQSNEIRAVELNTPVPQPLPEPVLIQGRRPVPAPAAQAPVQRELVPQPAPVVSRRSHTVRAGETLWRISKKYGVTVAAIKRANGISNAKSLKIGKVLKIPSQ